jgi:hypothetical protein
MYNQTSLNVLLDNCQCGNLTKLKEKNTTHTLIIYTYDLYIVKRYRNKIDKLLFLNIYNGKNVFVIFRIIYMKKIVMTFYQSIYKIHNHLKKETYTIILKSQV